MLLQSTKSKNILPSIERAEIVELHLTGSKNDDFDKLSKHLWYFDAVTLHLQRNDTLLSVARPLIGGLFENYFDLLNCLEKKSY